MLLSDMRTKDFVEIWISTVHNEFYKFRSKVESSNEEFSTVLAPLSKAGWHPVHVSQPIIILHCKDGKVNKFLCEIVSIYQQGNTKLINIKSNKSGEEYNRRQYYRIGTLLDIEFSDSTGKPVKALCTNISGCGMGIRLPRGVELEIDSVISVKAKMEDKDFVCACKIVRKEETLDAVYPYYIGVSFQNLKMPELHMVLKYVNECQRRMLMARSKID